MIFDTLLSWFKPITLGLGGGGSSGSATPTQTTVTNTNLSPYAAPYVQNTLGQAQALTDINQNPYQPYTGQQVAGFTGLQNQAFQGIGGQQVAPQIQQATDLANQSGQAGMNAVQNSQGLQDSALGYGQQGSNSGMTGQNLGITGGAQYGQQGAGYGAQAAGQAGMDIGMGMAGMQSGMSYGQNATNPNAVQAYMNPYLQNTLQPAMKLLNQQYDQQGAYEQGTATNAGAFGGSREALMQGLNNQNRDLASNQLVSNAYNQAYNTANTNMQQAASLGMQGAQTGIAGLNAANQAYQTGIAGANTGLQGVNTQLSGTAQGMQGAQTGISGVNAATNAGQYGLQGAGMAGQSAGILGQLGQTQYNQQTGINQGMLGAGAQQQALDQQNLNVGINQYNQQLQYPYQQLAFMQGMYQGLPMTQSAQSMYQNPSAVSQLGGLGAAGYGAYKLATGKRGGQVRRVGDGLDTLGIYSAMKGH